MAHMQQFQGIPMSKSMRGLCKEEDYEFLGIREKNEEHTNREGMLEDDWSKKREERARRQLERENLEKKRMQEIEESKKEKEQQWKIHVAELVSNQEKSLQDRMARIRKFREFERKVLVEESRSESSKTGTALNQTVTRML